ncbi:MAG TPA: signal peptidase I [Polyangiaceae bacterium]
MSSSGIEGGVIADQPAGSGGRRALGAALRALWFGVVPLLLTAVTWRYLVPRTSSLTPGALRDWAAFCDQHLALVWPALFLFYSFVARHFRAYLPGAAHWCEAPPARASALKNNLLWFVLVLFAAGSALLLRASLFQTYRVLSASMLPNMRPNDLLLASRSAYGFKWPGARSVHNAIPKRGDVIVFHHELGPGYPDELVKRVVGLPGDLIHMYGGHPFINGWRVPDCDVGQYVYAAGEGMLDGRLRVEFLGDAAYLTVHGPWDHKPRPDYVLKPGEVFVLGDNRNNSSDSRAWNDGKGGGLPVQEIRGRVDRYVFPVHRNGEIDTAHALNRLAPQLFMDGVEISPLREGIARCLQQRPKDTVPPPAQKPQP